MMPNAENASPGCHSAKDSQGYTHEPREPVPAEEVADALKAIAKPHPTDPSVTLYERKGQIVGWDRARLPKETS